MQKIRLKYTIKCRFCFCFYQRLLKIQPNGIVLQTDINLSLSVFSLIYNNLVLFHELHLFPSFIYFLLNLILLILYIMPVPFLLADTSGGDGEVIFNRQFLFPNLLHKISNIGIIRMQLVGYLMGYLMGLLNSVEQSTPLLD